MKIISEYILNPTTPAEIQQKELQEKILGPVPPLRYIRSVKSFWLVYVDTDGRSWEPIPYVWQAGAQRWCNIGAVATGYNLDLRNHVIISEVQLPPIEHIEYSRDKIVVTESPN